MDQVERGFIRLSGRNVPYMLSGSDYSKRLLEMAYALGLVKPALTHYPRTRRSSRALCGAKVLKTQIVKMRRRRVTCSACEMLAHGRKASTSVGL